MAEHKSSSEVLAADPKEKQKMTVLFMEMVRLADTVEKMESGLGSISRNYENKLQQLDYKLANEEKNLALMTQRNINGN